MLQEAVFWPCIKKIFSLLQCLFVNSSLYRPELSPLDILFWWGYLAKTYSETVGPTGLKLDLLAKLEHVNSAKRTKTPLVIH